MHLDIVPDLSTKTFTRCLKIFAARSRRGLLPKFILDNGKTFQAAARRMKLRFSHEVVQNYLSGRGVDGVFNLKRAPWWGGGFEKIIQSTKRCQR